MEPQEVLREEFAEHFAGCEEVQEFFRAHRGQQRKPTPAHHAVTWTTARSYRTFLVVVHLCECGYGQQAAMLNRTLFEDMISAHWAVKHPETAAKRLIEHDQYTATLRAEMYTEHRIPFAPPQKLPTYTDEERERLNKRYRDGSSAWTGKTLPRMVKAVAPMWEEVDRRLLHQMHDIAHRAHNTLLHHSATSLSLGVTVSEDDEANDTVTFNVGPSRVFVQPSLSFALWTFPNTFSLLLDVKGLAGLNELMSKHSHLYSTARASTTTE